MFDCTILVVDDEDLCCETVAGVLRSSGYNVFTALDGVEALILLELVRPDLILLDLQSSRIDGLAMIGRLRANLSRRETPIVVSSGTLTAGDRTLALKAGADGFLQKPFQTKDLQNVVGKHLPGHRPKRESEATDRSSLGLVSMH